MSALRGHLANTVLVKSATKRPCAASFASEWDGVSTLILALRGCLDVHSTGSLWWEALGLVRQHSPRLLVVDAHGLEYCDGAGIALLLELRRHQAEVGAELRVEGLRDESLRLLRLFGDQDFGRRGEARAESGHLVEEFGRVTLGLWAEFRSLVEFTGELTWTAARSALSPSQVRWRDTLRVAELAGVDALGIVLLIGFLMGLIMAFESAIPMRQFGAEIFVADLVGLAMFRELGPLMTAVVLAGRSGSAFAAELGTMRIKEEIDALSTMGLDPVPFLVVPRVLAAVLVTPLLAIFASLAGIAGGALVMLSLGYPVAAYINQMMTTVTYVDVLSGLVKSLAFGLLVAAIGCLRGLQTGAGASAVGRSTTRAVVSGIILVALADGLFAIVYYYLGV